MNINTAMNCLWAEVARYNEDSRVREAWQTLKTSVEIANSVQQLKAEIAALEKKLFTVNGADMYERNHILSICVEMRQLSAV